MTSPDRPRPLPGPPGARLPVPGPAVPRPVTAPAPGDGGATAVSPSPDRVTDAADTGSTAAPDGLPDLAGRPLSEHVAVFEAEHARLQRRLSTIDQL